MNISCEIFRAKIFRFKQSSDKRPCTALSLILCMYFCAFNFRTGQGYPKILTTKYSRNYRYLDACLLYCASTSTVVVSGPFYFLLNVPAHLKWKRLIKCTFFKNSSFRHAWLFPWIFQGLIDTCRYSGVDHEYVSYFLWVINLFIMAYPVIPTYRVYNSWSSLNKPLYLPLRYRINMEQIFTNAVATSAI